MSQVIHSQSRGSWLRALLVGTLAVLCWPTSAFADLGRCVEMHDLAEQGVETFVMDQAPAAPSGQLSRADLDDLSEQAQQAAPCGGDDDADPSSNLCFEDADGQISTLPRLLTQWHARKAADAVVNSVFAAIAHTDVPANPRPRPERVSVPARPMHPRDNDSCTANPAKCRSLPPLAPTVTIDVATFAAHPVLHQTHIPIRLSTNQTRAWARLRIGPRHGHRAPPDKPPQA